MTHKPHIKTLVATVMNLGVVPSDKICRIHMPYVMSCWDAFHLPTQPHAPRSCEQPDICPKMTRPVRAFAHATETPNHRNISIHILFRRTFAATDFKQSWSINTHIESAADCNHPGNCLPAFLWRKVSLHADQKTELGNCFFFLSLYAVRIQAKEIR